MTQESVTYRTLRNKFHQLNEIDAKTILAFQFTWQDQFAKSIYQTEVKTGTIKLCYNQKEIDWNEMWRKRKFQKVISEWENYTPILAFNSIGECLLFYKSIFHHNAPLAIKLISNEDIQDIEDAYINYINEYPDWKYIEEVLYGTIHDLIQNGN